jgi:hypothetical protein
MENSSALPSPTPSWRKPARSWVLVAAAGFFLRLLLAYVSRGTQDISIWRECAAFIERHGICYVYEYPPYFNHPPLIAEMAALALVVARSIGLPFHFVFKVPAVFAELLTALLLWKTWSARSSALGQSAVLLFSGSLASILVSGYHANTDCICAFLCLLAAFLIERRRHFLAGLALAAAINIKLIPIVCIPALLAPCRSWRQRVLYASGLAVGALPFLPALLACPGAFYRSVLAYNSSFGDWGIPLLLRSTFSNPWLGGAAYAISGPYTAYGRYAILGSVIILSAWARLRTTLNVTTLAALSLAMFLVVTPGFGPQYTVWPIPLLFAVDVRGAWIYSTTAGAFIGFTYWSYLVPGFPLYSPLAGPVPMPGPIIGLLAWAVLALWIIRTIRGAGRLPAGRRFDDLGG